MKDHPASALRCPHGRAWEACVRCDPSCPRGLSEEQYDSWQATYDKARAANRITVPLDPNAVPAGIITTSATTQGDDGPPDSGD